MVACSGGIVSSLQQFVCSIDGTAILIRPVRWPVQFCENRGRRAIFESKQF
jgi:hypothetical protein